MLIRETRNTVDEFWEYAQLPENAHRRLELDGGIIVEMASSSPENTVIAGLVIYHLNAFVVPRKLGYVTVPDGGFKLAEDKARQPDAAFISKTRLPALPRVFELAPDLAVEVVSPNEDVLKKVNEYLHAGCQMVWTIYADEREVYVFRLGDEGQLIGVPHGIDDTLDGGDVLPGFSLAVRDLFPE